ncbi:hypothetical protein GY45DRAFT_985150 [Cubamyces sp. BRFM 1775]|nr:hypothetical protein GY45DRAFT_985150 [Cubamyces sp. BRFM 1775]
MCSRSSLRVAICVLTKGSPSREGRTRVCGAEQDVVDRGHRMVYAPVAPVRLTAGSPATVDRMRKRSIHLCRSVPRGRRVLVFIPVVRRPPCLCPLRWLRPLLALRVCPRNSVGAEGAAICLDVDAYRVVLFEGSPFARWLRPSTSGEMLLEFLNCWAHSMLPTWSWARRAGYLGCDSVLPFISLYSLDVVRRDSVPRPGEEVAFLVEWGRYLSDHRAPVRM